MRVPSSSANAMQLRPSGAAERERPRSARDPIAAIETAYREITAPRVDMSRLIVDTRPGREHPLLAKEVDDLRLQAHVRRAVPHGPAAAPRRSPSRDSEDTLPTAIAQAETTDGAGRSRTVVERFSSQLPGKPASRRRGHASHPTTTTASCARIGSGGARALQSMLLNGFVMARGFKGQEVVELQTLLRRRGLRVHTSAVFDAETEAAVRAVQRRCGWSPDGIVDIDLLNALRGPR